MKHTKTALTGILAVLVVLLASGDLWAIQGPDEATVIRKDPRTGGPGTEYKKCHVLTDDLDRIKIKSAKVGTMVLKASEVYDIIPTGKAGSLPDAINKFKAGQYTQAVKKLDTARKLLKNKEWGEIYCSYYLGLCHIALGGKNTQKGVDFLAKFNSDRRWKKHRLVPWALYHRGHGARTAGSYADSHKAFNALATDRRFSKDWRFKGKIGLGQILVLQGKWGQAKTKFEEIKRRAAGSALMKNQATMYIAKCLFKLGDHEKAKSMFEEIIKQKGSKLTKEVIAGARNGLGDYYYKKSKGRNKGNLKAAMLQYMRVATLYTTIRDEYCKALYMAAKCFDGLPKYKRRAAKARGELKNRCPNSKWAKKP